MKCKLTKRTAMGIAFDLLVVSLLLLLFITLIELNRPYDIVKLCQPFKAGKIVDGKFVPTKVFNLGDKIYTHFDGEKKLQYTATVYLTIEDTFSYPLKPYDINSMVGKLSYYSHVPTSKSWNPGKYRVVGNLVYKNVGFLKREITYPIQSEEFELQ